MKKKFQKLTSMLLCAALCLQLLPAATVHTHAASEDRTFSKSSAVGDSFELQDGRSYLLVLETQDDSGEIIHYTFDPEYLDSGVFNTIEIFPESDGTFIVPADDVDIPVLTYRSGTNVSGLYLDDGSMLYWDTNSPSASIISADEAAALEDYRIFWFNNSDSDSDGVLYATPPSGDAYFVFGVDASTTDTDEMFYVNSSVAPDVTYYYLYEAPCPHTNAVLNTDIAIDATCMTPGTLPRWVCGDCNSYFADEALTQPLAVDEYVLDEATGHDFVDGVCVNCGSDRALYTQVRNQMQLEEVLYGGNNDVTGQVYEPTFMLVATVGDALYAMAPDLSLIPVSTNEIGMIPAEGLQAAQFSLVDTWDPDTYALRYAILLPNEWLYAEETALATLPVLYPNTLDQGPLTDNGYWQLMLYDPDAEYYDAQSKTTMTMSEYMTANTSLTELGKGALLLYEHYTNDPAQTLRMQSNDDGYSLVLGPDVEGAGTQIALYLYASVDHSRDADEGHSWRTTYEDGVHMNQCACGLYIETEQHNWKAEISDPTCTEDGTVWLFCEGCQATHSPNGTVIPATGHNWSPWYLINEPDTGEPGSEIRYCLNNCGTYDENGYTPYSETRTIPYLGHTAHNLQYVEKVEATCSENGVEAHYACQPEEATTGGDGSEYCYNLYADANGTQQVTMEDLMIPIQDHAWGEWVDVDTSNADYTVQSRTCFGCGETQERNVPPGGHVHQMVYVEAMEPGCFPGNIAYYVCDYYGTTEYEVGCGCYFEDAEGTVPLDAEDVLIPAIGHNWGEWYNTGNEKEAGMHERQCLDCQHIEWGEHIVSPYAENSTDENECYYVCMVEGCDYHEVIGEHSLSDWEFDDDNSHIRYCFECGYEEREPHEYGSWSYNTYEDGTFHGRDCDICGGTQFKEADEHIWGEAVSVPPSCSEVGTDTVTCIAEGCEAQNVTEIPMLDHTPMEAVKENERESTCSVAGSYDSVVYCSVCKNELSRETVLVPLVAHLMSEWTETLAPGCETTGTEVSSCANCSYTESREIPATDHSYSSVVTAPTCTEQGYTTHTCSVCGDSYVDTYVAATGHTMSDWQQTDAPDCDTEGSKTRTCANCDYSETQTVEATGHKYGSVVTAPTCTVQGYTTYTCSDCGDSYVDTYVAATGHKYGIVVTAPTCTEQGYTTNTCSACGDSYVDTYVAAPGHTMSDWQQTDAPGCETAGSETRVCANCDYSETQSVEATGHKYGSVVTAPTCTAQGYTTHTCSACGDSYIDTYVEATGHSMGDWQQTDAPGCETAGSETRVCANCDYSETQTVEATGHKYGSVVTAPTCTAQGYTTHTCSACGDSYIDTYVEAAGHSMGDWVETVAPTYEQNGEERSDCANCDYYETRVVAALSHSYTSVVTPPTCTEQGYTTYTCSDCGDVYQENFVPALGHDYKESVTAPTCTDQGYTTYTCATCDDSYVGSYVPALGHALSDWVEVTTPTQIKDGLQVRHCSNGCDYAEECVIPAYGHTHHLVLVPGKAATCQMTGNIAYYKCEYEMTQEDLDADEATLNMSCSGLYIVPDGGEMVSEDDFVLVSKEDVIIPLADHDMGEWVTDENKSNEMFTVQIRTCRYEKCGYSESRNLPGANHVHNMTMVQGVAPGCLTNGNITYFFCEGENGCGNAYADAQGSEILEKEDLILPALGHSWSDWTSGATEHQRTCSVCGEGQSEAHIYSHTAGTENVCVLTCLICDHDTTFGAHAFAASWVPCGDRWQHQKACTNNCGYTVIENHSFAGWVYGNYQLPESSVSVVIHYRTCGCGASETTGGHIWDEGTANGNRTVFHCIASGCTGVKEEYLRCFHTCFTCGKCTADETCHGKDTCTCVVPEPLPLVDPDVIINTVELPYLGDIIIRDEDAPLDPDAVPGQEIPDEYAGYRIEIKEIPLDVDDARDNPYTQYVIQALDGYSPVYMFDIHLLDGEGDIIYSQENEQYLIRLNLEAQIVQDIRDGLVRLAHVTEDGTTFYGVSADKSVLPFYKLEGTMAWFWADSFSPFTLVEPEAPYFGRSALAKMDNKDNLLYAYDALVAGVEASEAKIQIYADTPAITIDEAKMVMDAYTRDHTEHFWLDNKYSLTYQKDTVFAKHIKPVYTMTGDALEQAKETFNAAVDELLKGVTEASEFDRQLILHDRLAAQVTYDYSFAKPDIYNAYGAIVRGEAVCQGYSEALQYLLRRVGIQSFIVTGYSNDVSHAWNQVKVDNEYYHTDLTWNDQEKRLYHAYFNMNDPYITEDHEIYITAYPTVECADMSANYFTVKELARESGEIDDIAKLLKANNYHMSIMLTGSTSAKDFIDWFAENYLAIIKAAGISDNVLSCSFSRLGREAVVEFKLKVPVAPEVPDEPENPDPSVSVSAEKSAGAVSVTAKCTGSMNGYLVIAVYNGSNKMIGVKIVEEAKLRGGTYSISISRSETPTQVKAFVLDPNYNPMLPEAVCTIP